MSTPTGVLRKAAAIKRRGLRVRIPQKNYTQLKSVVNSFLIRRETLSLASGRCDGFSGRAVHNRVRGPGFEDCNIFC